MDVLRQIRRGRPRGHPHRRRGAGWHIDGLCSLRIVCIITSGHMEEHCIPMLGRGHNLYIAPSELAQCERCAVWSILKG